ncbi:hypothetical protein D2Q93_06275 [Alicyclobacillaceae bacterium I2511]|nr:hypothetical protein D2Q93_06275 [Alicyclobacillaceae bacterium I2511]
MEGLTFQQTASAKPSLVHQMHLEFRRTKKSIKLDDRRVIQKNHLSERHKFFDLCPALLVLKDP